MATEFNLTIFKSSTLKRKISFGEILKVWSTKILLPLIHEYLFLPLYICSK